jgi:hypothetical protein
MTNPACATRTGKIAKTGALWRAPLRPAQPCVTCTGTPAGTHSAQGAMSELACTMLGSNVPRSKRRGSQRPGSKRPGSKRPGSLFACVACKEPLFALDQAHLTHVFAMGRGETTGLRCESNGPALQFKPGGT